MSAEDLDLKDFETVVKEVKKSGSGAVAYFPKELIGKRVIVLVNKKDLEEFALKKLASSEPDRM